MSGWLKGLGWRFWCLFLACVALALSFGHPTLPLPKAVYRYVFVIDITQSMNARDYHVENLPPDRLGFVKASIRQALHDLPCGSEVGLGLFTNQTSQLLFEPLEICQHFAVIDDVLAHIDWRMAWAADSYIAPGLYTSIRDIAERGANLRLAFFTDGQQTPPGAEHPHFHNKRAEVRGLIVGVGGAQPVPIPKLDRENRPQGFWEYVDLKNVLPPTEAAGRRDSNYYLSRQDEKELLALAGITGLRYYRLEDPAGLSAALREPEFAEERTVAADIRGLLALLALALVIFTDLAGQSKPRA